MMKFKDLCFYTDDSVIMIREPQLFAKQLGELSKERTIIDEDGEINLKEFPKFIEELFDGQIDYAKRGGIYCDTEIVDVLGLFLGRRTLTKTRAIDIFAYILNTMEKLRIEMEKTPNDTLF